MSTKNNIRYQSKIHSGTIRLITILVLIGVLGFATIPKYAISWDEEASMKVVHVNHDIVTGIKDYYSHLEYYGTLFNLAADVLYKGQEIITAPISDGTSDGTDEFRVRIALKHRFTFLLSLVTYVAVAGLVGILAGFAYAWLGPLLLMLIPRFWGHSYFNPKDIPFAMMFTVGTLCGTWLIRYYHRQQSKVSLGLNGTTVYSALYGILVGCAAGARIDASVLAGFVPLVDVLLRWQRGEKLKQILRFGQFYAVMLGTCILTIVTIYPASWANPLRWYLRAFNFYYKEDWPHTVLFNGSSIPAKTVPWYYLPTWVGITTPVVVLLLFLAGLILATLKYRRLSVGQQACLLLLGLQILGLPVFAMLYQATVFDGLRTALYLLPAIATISAVAIAWIYQLLRRRLAKLALVAGLITLALPIVVDMTQLHPYEYVYFNRAVGGLAAASEGFETDYWGLSMAEAVIWLNQHQDRALPLVSTEPLLAVDLLADEDLTVIPYDEFEPNGQPFYYLSIPRWGWHQRFAECPVVYSANRQQASLAIVKQCN